MAKEAQLTRHKRLDNKLKKRQSVFDNFVNRQDFYALIKYGPQALSTFLTKLRLDKTDRTKAAWSHTQKPPKSWGSIPAVQSRWSYLISGDPEVDYYEYISRKYLRNRNALSALSLGCGTGHRELKWTKHGKFGTIDAYDISQPRINEAARKAAEQGYADIIHYYVGDIFKIEVHENSYDVVLGEQSLHHFSPLKQILSRVNRFLKPEGYFIVNEFVGPSRFQWSQRQLEIVNSLLSILPSKYKTLWNSSRVKPDVFRPSYLRMLLLDPSEAVESSRILPLLDEIFEVVEVKEYGGTILALLLNGIAHNFSAQDTVAQQWLNICFTVEDLLLEAGEIQSDFAFVVCKKRA